MNNSPYKFFLSGSAFLFVAIVLSYSQFNVLPDKIELLLPVQSQKHQSPPFNPRSLSWSLATSSAQWDSRDSAISFIFQHKMWTMGGINGNKQVDSNHNVRYWEAPHFNDIWTSEDGITWKMEKSHAQWPPRRSMSVVLFQNTLWMFGGWSPINGYTSDIWQSSDGITWTKAVSNAPWPPREGQTTEIFKEKIWMMGGVNYDKREIKNDVWWSDNGIDWHQATTTIPWGPRWDHATAVFNKKMFLAGGMNLHKDIFRDIWSSTDGLHWELVNANPPWQERQGHSLVIFHNKLWTIGRLNDAQAGGVNDVWYSNDGANWQKTETDPPWLGREDHSVLIFKGNMFVFGGMDSNWQWRNDVWFLSNETL